jgi:UPF0176 protein
MMPVFVTVGCPATAGSWLLCHCFKFLHEGRMLNASHLPILNISAYRFVHLADTVELKQRIQIQAQANALKGTVLLATEGINLFLAGEPDGVHAFVAWLEEDSRFAAFQPKESWSHGVPFGKLVVKVKPEIIRMNHPAIEPASGRAPSVDAATLARWLDAGHDDEGRAVVTLDTRNAFEISHGQFQNALDWNLQKFSEFPQAAIAHQLSLKGKTVVSYCTGGIRCEKAALFMRELGVENVLQLEGGILKYFEITDGRHFDGTCFVFDEREAVGVGLKEA